MTSRLQSFVNSVAAVYAGAPDTTWYVGAEHIHRHENFERIVVYPTDGQITAPRIAGGGRTTESGGIDNVAFERRVKLEFAIWARDYEQGEGRLHAVLLAIEEILSQADLSLENIGERWIFTGEIASGGTIVVLSCAVTFEILEHDKDIVAYDAATNPTPPRPEVGDGAPTTQAESVTIIAEQDGEEIANLTFDEET